MRILIAVDKVSRVLTSQMLANLARYGSVEVVQSGRDAVLAYVKAGSRGAFHDLIVLDQHLAILNGFAAVEMIRSYESEQGKSRKRAMVCVILSDDLCRQHYEGRYIKDERTHLLGKPVNLDFLESLAGSVAAELETKSHADFDPTGFKQPLGMQA